MFTFRSKIFVLLVCSTAHLAASTAEVWQNTDKWFAVPTTYNPNYSFDPAKDAQTGDPRAEFVGNADNPGFYFAYDSDTNGALNPDGRLLFRVRVAAFQTNSQVPTNNPGEYGSAIFIGIDGNGDGAIDVFVVADDRGSAGANGVKLYFPACPKGSTSCFTGPSSTNLGSQFGTNTVFSTTGAKQNFHWAQVSTSTDPRSGSEAALNNNIVAGTEGANSSYRNVDGFFSFAIDFRSVGTALASTIAPTQINNFTPSSSMRFLAITAQQTSSFNQDTGGCDNSAPIGTWACGLTDPIVPMNFVTTPEPGTYATMIVALLGLGIGMRRRNASR